MPGNLCLFDEGIDVKYPKDMADGGQSAVLRVKYCDFS